MISDAEFGPVVRTDALRVTPGSDIPLRETVAAEIPFTIIANDVELATLLASPSHLKELTYGYLFTSGFIASAGEATEFACDNERWTASVKTIRQPDPVVLRKRLYTSGCGKCAMYASVNELNMRRPCGSTMTVDAGAVVSAARWIAGCSAVFRETGGVHAAGLFDPVKGPLFYFEDVARHNAVDKVIGRAIIDSIDMSGLMLARTGRTSSEIVFKTRRANLAVTIARGAPTHQAIHLARDMGITLIGFAREDGFTVYTNQERIRR